MIKLKNQQKHFGLLPMSIILWVALLRWGEVKFYSPVIEIEDITEKTLGMNSRGESRINEGERGS